MVTGIIALALFGAAIIYGLYKAFWPRKPRYVTACSVNNNVFVVDDGFLEYGCHRKHELLASDGHFARNPLLQE